MINKLIFLYHGTIGGKASISPLNAWLLIIGAVVLFILIIWFFRKAGMSTGKKGKKK